MIYATMGLLASSHSIFPASFSTFRLLENTKISVALNIFVGHKVDLNFLPFSPVSYPLRMLFAFFRHFLLKSPPFLLPNASINKKHAKAKFGAEGK